MLSKIGGFLKPILDKNDLDRRLHSEFIVLLVSSPLLEKLSADYIIPAYGPPG